MITASEMEGVSQRPMIDSVVKNLLGEWRRTDAHRPKFRLREVVIGHGRILTGSELSTLSRAWHEEIRAHHWPIIVAKILGSDFFNKGSITTAKLLAIIE